MTSQRIWRLSLGSPHTLSKHSSQIDRRKQRSVRIPISPRIPWNFASKTTALGCGTLGYTSNKAILQLRESNHWRKSLPAFLPSLRAAHNIARTMPSSKNPRPSTSEHLLRAKDVVVHRRRRQASFCCRCCNRKYVALPILGCSLFSIGFLLGIGYFSIKRVTSSVLHTEGLVPSYITGGMVSH